MSSSLFQYIDAICTVGSEIHIGSAGYWTDVNGTVSDWPPRLPHPPMILHLYSHTQPQLLRVLIFRSVTVNKDFGLSTLVLNFCHIFMNAYAQIWVHIHVQENKPFVYCFSNQYINTSYILQNRVIHLIFLQKKKIIKLKGDLHCLARM